MIHMKCTNCGMSGMTTKRENLPYAALPSVVLVGVDVSRCVDCGEYEVTIQNGHELERAIVEVVIGMPRRLTGNEVRFLRTQLGVNGTEFARLIGSTASTVSRWETEAQPIGEHADKLLRALVLLKQDTTGFELAKFAEISGDVVENKPKGPAYRLQRSGKQWKSLTA